jgi:aspartate kinase
VARLVQKFGGTSVGDPERIRDVADYVARCRRRGDEIVLVVSAMGKETDDLLRIASEVSSTRPGREMDMLITAGERKAIALVCMALADLGVEAESYTGSQAGSSPTPTTPTPRSSRSAPIASRLRSTPAGCRWSPAPRVCRPTTT